MLGQVRTAGPHASEVHTCRPPDLDFQPDDAVDGHPGDVLRVPRVQVPETGRDYQGRGTRQAHAAVQLGKLGVLHIPAVHACGRTGTQSADRGHRDYLRF